MERRGPKERKTEHEEVKREVTPEPESEDTPRKRKIPSAKGDTAQKVDDPKKEPQLDGDKVIREQRKRHAPAPDVEPPKKTAPPLVTEPTAAETDKSSVDDVLALQVGNLSIGQRGRDYRLQGAIPRSQSELLVSRERSGYLIAQASFLVSSSESASGGDGSVPSGSGVSGPSDSSYAGVDITEMVKGLPIITIDLAEKEHADTIAKYNEMVRGIGLRFESYRNILQFIPVLDRNIKRAHVIFTIWRKCTPQLDLAKELGCHQLECVFHALVVYLKRLNESLEDCKIVAEDIIKVYSSNNPIPREIFEILKIELEVVARAISRCDKEVYIYEKTRIQLSLRFSEAE